MPVRTACVCAVGPRNALSRDCGSRRTARATTQDPRTSPPTAGRPQSAGGGGKAFLAAGSGSAKNLAPTLLSTIVGTRAFEVDEFADHHVSDDLSEDWRVRVAECAYQHGLQRDQVLAVLRVVLRDELLRIGNFVGPEDRPANS